MEQFLWHHRKLVYVLWPQYQKVGHAHWHRLHRSLRPLGRNTEATRWSSRYESLTALRYRYVDIMKTLTKIALTTDKKDERGEASGLKKNMEKFSFIFLVVLQTKVLESVNVVSKILHDTNTDIEKAVKLLENTILILSEYRGAFDGDGPVF